MIMYDNERLSNMKLPRYKYSELTPEHEVWGAVDVWGEEDSEWVDDECINDVVEYILDVLPENLDELGDIEVYGFEFQEYCPIESENGQEGYEVRPVAVVVVNALEWAEENRPDWLEERAKLDVKR